MTLPAPVAVALDTDDLETVAAWAAAVGPYIRTVKVGLELYLRHGAAAVTTARDRSGGREVFLDLKLHDIPNTVAGAARSVADLAPDYLTVHASGGHDMVRAAVDTLPGTTVVGVTVLTSLSDEDLGRLGMTGTARDVVRRLAVLAVGAGARALVCSPLEVADVRREVGPDVVLVTPGVRPPGAGTADQSRVATPARALADGADLLVVGRPITGAPDVGRAARDLANGLPTRPTNG
ncbi:MAG: orotidine-5'-phosphate decarboxylase [Actinomycetes bacterium]